MNRKFSPLRLSKETLCPLNGEHLLLVQAAVPPPTYTDNCPAYTDNGAATCVSCGCPTTETGTTTSVHRLTYTCTNAC